MPDGTKDGMVPAKPCPQAECRSYNPPDAQFCAQCGRSLAAIEPVSLQATEYEKAVGSAEAPKKPCPNAECGFANPAQARFCAQCGKPLPAELVEKPAPPESAEETPKGPLMEIVQPFIDLVHAPRALWGINLAYVIEGMVYFGMLGYLAIHCSDFIFQAVENADVYSHNMVGVLTAGITLAMVFLGCVADKWGVRFALISAFVLMLIGRTVMSGAPNVFGLEPARPGVFAGDKVTLHVTELDTVDGVKAITQAEVLANDESATGVVGQLSVDLSIGRGIAPSLSLESHLVRLGSATLLEGEGHEWEVRYGSAPVTAKLLIHSAEEVGLCPGATISLAAAYVTRFDETGEEFVIRTHWREDLAAIDTSGCAEQPELVEGTVDEQQLRSESRWPVSEASDLTEAAPRVGIADLHTLEDGAVDVVLPDVYVSYVRNGGYFLQTQKDGPAIYAYVDPAWSPLHLATMLGILFVVIGYGMYQPAAYAGVRLFTNPKTAGMAFAMLYALMNLGGWLPSFAFLLRDEDFLGLGIPGTWWFYTACTLMALLITIFILSKSTVARAIVRAKAETAEIEQAAKQTAKGDAPEKEAPPEPKDSLTTGPGWPPIHLQVFILAMVVTIFFNFARPEERNYLHLENTWVWYSVVGLVVAWIAVMGIPPWRHWVTRHPLADAKFFYFIFALIPVQTLFTYNWFILPQYISRSYVGWIGEYFEVFSNMNPLLIFVAAPIIAAVTVKRKVYNMMIAGTFVMAAPAFLLAIGPSFWTLAGYIVFMTIGEAMWQPRFLQYAAEIAPEGRTGMYMGVAQLPWFLTKVLVPLLYSGRVMAHYCPADGPKDTETMWFIFGCIAISSTILLLLAKGWVGKDFKTKAD